jgi:glycosyltransferase involved in cell wall biosynthesis
MNTARVCYIIYGEEIWSPLLRRQVVELLETAVQLDKQLTVRLLYIIPWYWSFTKRKKLENFIQNFRADAIDLRVVRLPYPFPFPYFLPKYVKGRGFRPYETHSGFTFWLVQLLVLPLLIKYALIDKYRIFHARSYRASALVLPLRRLTNRVALVFDPRSDYPEENLIQSAWERTGFSFRYWKRKERNLLKYASTTICISDYYQHHFQTIYPGLFWDIIPNNVDCARFRFNPDERRQIRAAYGLQDKLVFCYLGTMSTQSWHNPTIYAQLIRQFEVTKPNHLFLFLVPADTRSVIESVFDKVAIDRSSYLIISPDYEDIPKFLSAADFGLLYLQQPKIALGTKIVEYTAVGLPVLVNSNIISAAVYVEKYRAGKVIDIGLGGLDVEKASLQTLDLTELRRSYSSELIAKQTELLFSNKTVAQSYINIYQRLSPGLN